MGENDFKNIEQLDYWIKRAKDAESQLKSLTEENERLRRQRDEARWHRDALDTALDEARAQEETD